MSIPQHHPQTISEQAAQWLCELAEGGAKEQAAFLVWLRQSPRHVEEFLFATTTWKQLQQFGAGQPMDIDAILTEAFGTADAANVVSLQKKLADKQPAVRPSSARSRWTVRIAAAIAFVTLGTLAGLWLMQTGQNTYTTALGEQRSIRLADGSVVQLNTQSRLEVAFSKQARELRLTRGEALFIVHHDPVRPFRVDAGKGVIQAIGTQFNVYRRAHDTAVSVLEGAVRISVGDKQTAAAAGAAPHKSVNGALRAGEQAFIRTDGRVVKQETVDIAQAVAWRERRLVFKAARLEEVAAEVNRYSPRPVRIEGQTARDTLLTATFAADSPESLAEFLKRYSNLQVEHRDGEVVIRER